MITTLLDYEIKAQIDPINEYMRHTFKAFSRYIVANISQKNVRQGASVSKVALEYIEAIAKYINNALGKSVEVEFRLPRLQPDSRWAYAVASYNDINIYISVNDPKGEVGGKPSKMSVNLRRENEEGFARLQQIADKNNNLKIIGKGNGQYARLEAYKNRPTSDKDELLKRVKEYIEIIKLGTLPA